jgi:hypothetical protein
MRILTWAALLAILGLLVAAQYVFTYTLWTGQRLSGTEAWQSLACLVPVICTLQRLPPGFGLGLVAACVAAVLFGLITLRRPFDRPLRDLEQPAATAVGPNPTWLRVVHPALLVLGLGAGLYLLFVGASTGKVAIPLWLLPLAALGVFALIWDWQRRVAFLTVADTLFLGSCLCLLVGLAGLGGHNYPLGLAALAAAVLCLVFTGRASRGMVLPACLFPSWGERALLLGLLGLAFLVYAGGLWSWRYAVVGDEYSFLITARDILAGTTRLDPLSPRGIYNYHPVLTSFYQAFFMHLLGVDSYGWRVSSLLAVLGAALPIALVARTLASRQVMLTATALYLSSHYLMGFSMIGYNNTQAMLPFWWAIACLLVAIRRESLLGMFLAGLCGGLAFYSFGLARLVVVPLGLVGICYLPRFWRKKALFLTLAITFAATVFPVFLDPVAWQRMGRDTIFYYSEVTTTVEGRVLQFGQNLAYSLFSSFYSNGNSHFVYGAHVDPVTSSLLFLGLIALLAAWRSWRGFLFLTAGVFLMIALVGATHQYAYPPNTRMFFLLPFYVLLAGLGLERLGQTVEWQLRLRGASRVLAVVIVTGALLLNLYQAFVLSPSKQTYHIYALLLQVSQTWDRPYVAVMRTGFQRELPDYISWAYRVKAGSDRLITYSEFWSSREQLRRAHEDDGLLIVIDRELPEREAVMQEIRSWSPDVRETAITRGQPPWVAFTLFAR